MYDLHFEIQKLNEQLQASKQAHAHDIKMNELAVADIQEQYASNKRYSRKLKAEIKKLRQYKSQTESVNREYQILKKEKQKTPVEMFSKESEMKTIRELHQQLELAENYRLNKFTNEFIEYKAQGPQLRHQFLNDMSLLTNEMLNLDSKAKHIVNVQKWRDAIPESTKAITHDFYFQMRDLDGQKFKNYIEIYTSRDLKNYELLDRSQITFLVDHKVMRLPPGVVSIKIVHGRYGYTQPHPIITPVVAPKQVEVEEEPKVVPNTTLWSMYRSRYHSKYPPHGRTISLSQVRDLVYIIYSQRLSQRLTESSAPSAVDNLQQLLFDTLDKFYVLPEVVMKVSYELLTAIDSFKKQHYVR
jgi:hypothetical protein